MRTTLTHLFRLLLVVALQLVLFNPLHLSTYLYPCPYVIFLLLFPFAYPTEKLLLWSFLLGMTLDILGAGIPGLHTAACLSVAFLRPLFLKQVATKAEFDAQTTPSLQTLSLGKYFILVLLCLLTHHCIYFGLESFSVQLFPYTLARITSSLILNFVLIFSMQYALFSRIR